jgi:hypothetical protein
MPGKYGEKLGMAHKLPRLGIRNGRFELLLTQPHRDVEQRQRWRGYRDSIEPADVGTIERVRSVECDARPPAQVPGRDRDVGDGRGG